VGSRPSILDEFKPVIDEMLAGDKLTWGKQRHTAKRVWERLRDEHHYGGQYSQVQRYVKAKRAQERIDAQAGGFNLLEWPPASVQVDFGEADFSESAGLTRLPYLTVSFPFSNQGFVQVFRGETAECVCQGLQDVFEAAGGVPTIAVFDNATGVGRRLGDVIREAEVFRLFRLHHRFEVRFCNPYSGHEKGNVWRTRLAPSGGTCSY
jgi:transposase